MATRGEKAKSTLKEVFNEALTDFFKDEEAPKKDEKKEKNGAKPESDGLDAVADFLDIPADEK